MIEPIDAPFDRVAKAMVTGKADDVKRRALFSGPLPIADVELYCAVLDDETRVLSATSIFKAFKRPRKGANTRLEIGGDQLPPFLAAKNLEPYINQELIGRTKLIKYRDGTAVIEVGEALAPPKIGECPNNVSIVIARLNLLNEVEGRPLLGDFALHQDRANGHGYR